MFSTNQLLEIFVVLCTVDHYRYVFSKVGDASDFARSKSGPVRPDSMPTRLSILISPIQGLAYFLIPTVYIISVVASGFHQPKWMNPLALPDTVDGVELDDLWKNTIRVAASVASIAMQSVVDHVFEHLSDQFHPIGRREKSRIIQTGPYAWVRHPLYSVSLSQTVFWTFMYWSYAPLFALVAAVVVYAVKIPIEEEAILRDDAVKEEYREYMCKVPAKLIPYVW
ncbi:hypothetical protein V8E55_003377 [Tylopilus felleus]